jgi:uncharacterized protein (DUF983 family)
MFKKGTKLYSILNGKCPRCNEGAFFKYSITFNPSKVTKLHENCSKCNLKYMIEPSFFYGAMYVNYGITVAISISTFLVAKLIFNGSLLQSFAAIFIALIVLAPVNLRLSRIIWIHLFIAFDEKYNKNVS